MKTKRNLIHTHQPGKKRAVTQIRIGTLKKVTKGLLFNIFGRIMNVISLGEYSEDSYKY